MIKGMSYSFDLVLRQDQYSQVLRHGLQIGDFFEFVHAHVNEGQVG